VKLKRLSFSKLIDWYWDELFFIRKKLGKDRFVGNEDPCQCETEQIIENSSSPKVIRSFMLIGVLLDQMMWTHYFDNYQTFRDKFKLPKLYSHGGGGMSSPNWFVYSYNNYNNPNQINWITTKHVADVILLGFYKWLKNETDRDTYRNFQLTILDEINKEFEKENRNKLRSIVSDIHSDLIYL